MFRFFGKLRKSLIQSGKPGRYLRYAIGEILLVVIGILIALQINNWNEKRVNKMIANEYLQNMKRELSEEIQVFEDAYISRFEKKMKGLILAKTYFENPIPIKDTLVFLNEVAYGAVWSQGIEPYNQSVFESLKSTGVIRLIPSSLRNEIFRHYDHVNSVVSRSKKQKSNFQRMVNGARPFNLKQPEKIDEFGQIRFLNRIKSEAFYNQTILELSNAYHNIDRIKRSTNSAEALKESIEKYLNDQ